MAEEKEKAELEERPDVLSIMAEIRKRVTQDAEAHKDKRGEFAPAQAQFDGNLARKAGELLYSEELRYLNTHYAYSTQLDLNKITSHRPGPIGRVIVKVKQKILRIIWDSLLREYFAAEREFQANSVRFLNDVAKYFDARDAQNFWELVRKIDYDVTKALERIERINDEQTGTLRSVERSLTDDLNKVRQSVSDLRGEIGAHETKLSTIEAVARGLEGIVNKLSYFGSTAAPKAKQVSGNENLPSFSYLLLENRYRGSEKEIETRLTPYVDLFKSAHGPVLELGPGRGELQLLLKRQGINAYGVDTDEAMVKVALEKGVDARLGDGLGHLQSLPDGSLGGVIAIQVVEHLSKAQLEELYILCTKKVMRGGKIVFETVNPQSLLALSSNYFRDPTHIWPLHPDTLSYGMTLAGLKVVEVRKLSPVPPGALLQTVPVEDYMTPRWAQTLSLLNRNFAQLNEMLYGHQDYCVIAEVA
jgi:2-polyprenyl-3-methyl-5-hydroxy-6-metoxy-1,4-benzoquinol methylase